ncbi:MAG: hypothetical protein ACKOQ4_12455 [Mycobacterium sp.]
MNTTKTTGILAAALVAAGILIGGAAELSTGHIRYLADYGSNVTAENAERQAESKGVRHMGDHEDAPGYFERMDGTGE